MKHITSLFCLLTLLTGCSQVNAPLEEIPTFPEPEPVVISAPDLDFTLPIFPHESLHPTNITNQTNWQLAPLLYEGLYVLDDNFQAQPQLISNVWVENDGYRWVFTIKDGIYFWDGTPLTASIVSSALNEARAGYYAPRFSGITSVTSYQNFVTIDLNAPNWNLPALLDIPISYGGGSYPQGTGPYAFWPDELVLRRHDGWWGQAELPNTILLEAINVTSDLNTAFDGGNLSIIPGDVTENQNFGLSGNYQVWAYNSANLVYLGYNCTNPHLNATLRQIISLSIDRDSLIRRSLAGYGTATLYPYHPATTIPLPEWNYDPLFSAEQYYQHGNKPSLRLMVNGENQEKVTLAEQIIEQVAEYGLYLQLDPLPWADYLRALEQGDFDIYLAEISLTPDFNLSSLLSSWGEYNYGQYQDSGADQLWQSFRKDAWNEEWNYFYYFYDQMPIAPLCFRSGTALSLWGHLSYATPTLNNLFYGLEEWVVEQPTQAMDSLEEVLVEENSETLD